VKGYWFSVLFLTTLNILKGSHEYALEKWVLRAFPERKEYVIIFELTFKTAKKNVLRSGPTLFLCHFLQFTTLQSVKNPMPSK
jgi:hypothetical protein